MTLMTNILHLGALACLLLVSCTSQATPFADENTMDPRCEDVEEWRENLEITATYTDADEVSLNLMTGGEPVELTGEVSIEGAFVRVVYYNVDTLWYLLVPEEGATEITVRGVLRCTLKEETYTVTLTLSPDSDEIERHLEFGEAGDAGVGADAGN